MTDGEGSEWTRRCGERVLGFCSGVRVRRVKVCCMGAFGCAWGVLGWRRGDEVRKYSKVTINFGEWEQWSVVKLSEV